MLSTETTVSGIRCTQIVDPRFRCCFCAVHFLTPRSAQTAPIHALLTDLLTLTSQKYPTEQAMTRRLGALYHAESDGSLRIIGDAADLRFSMLWLDDAYTLEDTSLAADCTALLCDILLHPNAADGAFAAEPFQLCKARLLDEIACRTNNKRSYAADRAAECTFTGEPAGIPVLGTQESAEAITPQSALAEWQRILKTAPAEIICIVPREMPQLMTALCDALRSVGRVPEPTPLSAPFLMPEHVRDIREPMHVSQSKLVLTFRFAEDAMSRDTLVILTTMLGDMPESLLMTTVREEQGLCYYASATASYQKRILLIDLGTEPAQAEQAAEAVRAQLDRFRRGDIPAALRETALRHLALTAAEESDSVGGLAARCYVQHLTGETRSTEKLLADYAAVTAASLSAAANALIPAVNYLLCPQDGAPEDDL